MFRGHFEDDNDSFVAGVNFYNGLPRAIAVLAMWIVVWGMGIGPTAIWWLVVGVDICHKEHCREDVDGS